MFVVTVEFQIAPEHVDAFKPLMSANAAASVRDEPGCSQFDVAWDPTGKPVCFLYEIYDDEAAFKAHLASTHFKDFDAKVAEMIVEKTVRTWVRKDKNP